MKPLGLTLFVLSPALLYAAALLLFAARQRGFPRRCPHCGQRALRLANSVMMMLDDGGGRHHCEAWSFHVCRQCSQVFRVRPSGIEPRPADQRHWLEPPRLPNAQ